MTHLLDNVIWHSLETRHAAFARSTGDAMKFVDDVGPLAGLRDQSEKSYADLDNLVATGGVVGLFLDKEYTPRAGWSVVGGAPLIQMVRNEKTPPASLSPNFKIEKLGDEHSAAMQELAGLAKPGPFGPRTHALGNFFGVFIDGKLVAMSGERLKVRGYTEVSAVCTHPDHIGKGYAAALMTKVIDGIAARGETAFLHSRADNQRAIDLYQRLGFAIRLSGHFVALRRD